MNNGKTDWITMTSALVPIRKMHACTGWLRVVPKCSIFKPGHEEGATQLRLLISHGSIMQLTCPIFVIMQCRQVWFPPGPGTWVSRAEPVSRGIEYGITRDKGTHMLMPLIMLFDPVPWRDRSFLFYEATYVLPGSCRCVWDCEPSAASWTWEAYASGW